MGPDDAAQVGTGSVDTPATVSEAETPADLEMPVLKKQKKSKGQKSGLVL
jgi:hypothetical protein